MDVDPHRYGYTPVERWYSPNGRITRMTWLRRVVGAGFATLLVCVACSMLSHGHRRGDGMDPTLFPVVLAILGFVVFRFVQDAKRLHDMGRSGLWMVCAFMPVVNLVYLVFILFTDGEPFTNVHGPDPKGRGPVEDAESVADVFR